MSFSVLLSLSLERKPPKLPLLPRHTPSSQTPRGTWSAAASRPPKTPRAAARTSSPRPSLPRRQRRATPGTASREVRGGTSSCRGGRGRARGARRRGGWARRGRRSPGGKEGGDGSGRGRRRGGERERELRKTKQVKKKNKERKKRLELTAMHRMNSPVAAGSEKLGTIVTVVSSAMKAICFFCGRRERGGSRSTLREGDQGRRKKTLARISRRRNRIRSSLSLGPSQHRS